MPSAHQEFKSVVVIKRFMSYLKSAGVSKVNRALRARFSAAAVGLTGVCFRKPDVVVVCMCSELVVCLLAQFFFHFHSICKPFSFIIFFSSA